MNSDLRLRLPISEFLILRTAASRSDATADAKAEKSIFDISTTRTSAGEILINLLSFDSYELVNLFEEWIANPRLGERAWWGQEYF